MNIPHPRTPRDLCCDHEGEMRTHLQFDDDAAEAVLRGQVPADWPELATLVHFAEELKELGSRTIPPPAGRLAELLDSGLTTIDKGDQSATAGSKTRPGFQASGLPKWRTTMLGEFLGVAAAKLGAAAFATKAAVGVSLALGSVSGAAVADALPGPMQDRVAAAIEAVTPANLPDSGDDRPEPRQNGEVISDDAQDGGVDGRQLGEDAREESSVAGQPETGIAEGTATGQTVAPGQSGLDKAATTPANGKAPATAPVPPKASTRSGSTSRPAAPPTSTRVPTGTQTSPPAGSTTREAPTGTTPAPPAGSTTREAPTGTTPAPPAGSTTREAPSDIPTSAPVAVPVAPRR